MKASNPLKRMFLLVFALVLGQSLLLGQTPNFQLLDRSIVNVKVTCPFRPDDPTAEGCSGRATGIVLSERNGIARVLTARHEVHGVNADPKAKIELTFAFDQLKPMPAKLLSVSSEQLDLAVLEVELPKGANGFGTLPLGWLAQTNVKNGMAVWVVDGLWEPVQGTVASLVQGSDGSRVRYISKAANGYSGGPVFDGSGNVIAVHLRSRPELSTDLKDGVTLDAALKWLQSIGYPADSFNRLRSSTSTSMSTLLDRKSSAGDVSALRPLSRGDQGTLLFRAGKYSEALPLLSEAAKSGDGHAATVLSGMYLAGLGVPVNYAEANRLAKIGAAKGVDVAMNTLGASYVSGTGVPQDFVLGAHWYRLSADQGNPLGMYGLALIFSNGQVNADATAARLPSHQAMDTDKQAVYWLQRGSQAGDLRARSLLGIMYGNGRGGLVKDDRVAVQLFRSAADHGELSGMQLLGDWYLAGRVNGQRNFEQAVFWYKRAAALGDTIAKKRLANIEAANPRERF